MLSNQPYEKDKAGRRKPPRHCRYLGKPRANIRGHYRLGFSLIKQLQAIANLLNIEPYADLEWVKKGGMIRLGLQKANEHKTSHLDAIWEELRDESDDELELEYGLDYSQKKYG